MQLAIPDKCRTKKVVFHCSLNPHPDEHLDDDTLKRIPKSTWRSSDMESNLTSSLSTGTSLGNISISFQLEWIVRDESE